MMGNNEIFLSPEEALAVVQAGLKERIMRLTPGSLFSVVRIETEIVVNEPEVDRIGLRVYLEGTEPTE